VLAALLLPVVRVAAVLLALLAVARLLLVAAARTAGRLLLAVVGVTAVLLLAVALLVAAAVLALSVVGVGSVLALSITLVAVGVTFGLLAVTGAGCSLLGLLRCEVVLTVGVRRGRRTSGFGTVRCAARRKRSRETTTSPYVSHLCFRR